MTVLLRLALVLIVLAGSVIMAPSRGQIAGMTQITICAEGGTETLSLDAQGSPVAPHHPCPDCLPGLAIGPLPGTNFAQWTGLSLPQFLPVPRGTAANGRVTVPPAARDPPLSA